METSAHHILTFAEERKDIYPMYLARKSRLYKVYLKSIDFLDGKNIFIDLEIRNTNPLQNCLNDNAYTSPSALTIVGNTSSGKQFLKW